MDRALLSAAQHGFVPACCGGATGCFALYGAKVGAAARQWRRVDDPAAPGHTVLLWQHAATVAALAATSMAVTAEAVQDYRVYRTAPSLAKIERTLIRQRPFFARTTVLATAAITLLAARLAAGGLCLLQPQKPLLWHQRQTKQP